MTGTRVLTAAVLVPVVVGIVLFAPTWAVAACVAAVILVSLREFFSIAAKAGMHGYRRWTATAAIILLASEWAPGISAREGWPWTALMLFRDLTHGFPLSESTTIVVFIVGVAGVAVFTRRPVSEALPSAGVSAAGLLFIAWPLGHLVRLHAANDGGPRLLLLTMVIVWAGDTVAYFVGRAVGRHKLAVEISPNKTWEGAIGNLLGSVVAGVSLRWWLRPEMALQDTVAVAILVSIVGQMGDLLESAWKRSAGVKDSGTLLPGHGGMLDRIDALIFAGPVVWWYFWWMVWR